MKPQPTDIQIALFFAYRCLPMQSFIDDPTLDKQLLSKIDIQASDEEIKVAYQTLLADHRVIICPLAPYFAAPPQWKEALDIVVQLADLEHITADKIKKAIPLFRRILTQKAFL